MTASAFPARRRRLAALMFGASILVAGFSASAAASDDASQLVSKEATLTLAAEPAGPDGIVRGALSIDLADGWHTYWRDPGASGIPPTLDFSGTRGFGKAALHFAAPHRFGSDLTRGNGYTQATAIAFELTPKPGQTIDAVDAQIFLGVCRDICIPVQADLKVPAPEAGNPRVEAAFAALPATDASNGAIETATAPDGSHLTVTARYASPPTTPDLFVTGPEGWFFDEPAKPIVDGNTATFTVPIVERPAGTDKSATPPTIDVIATDGTTAFQADGFAVSAKPDAKLAGAQRP